MSYQDKYLKYKNKYIQLKNQYGGAKINDTVVDIVTSRKVTSKKVTKKKVTKQNAMLNIIKPLTEYNIYSVYWIYPNDAFRPEDYAMSATFKLVVSARNDQEAFDFIQTIIGRHDTPNHDTQKFWSDKSKLVFNLVGKSNLHSVALICKDSQQDTG